MAQFLFNCPQCGETVKASDAFRGHEMRCPCCGKMIAIPHANMGSPSKLVAKSIKCPHCGTSYEVDKTNIGRNAECATCHHKFIIGQVAPSSHGCVGDGDSNAPSVSSSQKNSLLYPLVIFGIAFVFVFVLIAILETKKKHDMGQCCIMKEPITLDFATSDISQSFLGIKWDTRRPMVKGSYRRFQYEVEEPLGLLDKVELSYNRQGRLHVISLIGNIDNQIYSDEMVLKEFNKCRKFLSDLFDTSILASRIVEGGDRLLGINNNANANGIVFAMNFPLRANPNRKASLSAIRSAENN